MTARIDGARDGARIITMVDTDWACAVEHPAHYDAARITYEDCVHDSQLRAYRSHELTASIYAALSAHAVLIALARDAEPVWPAVALEQNWDDGWTAVTLEDGTVVVIDGTDVFAHPSMSAFREGLCG